MSTPGWIRLTCLVVALAGTDCELVLGLEDTVAARRTGSAAGSTSIGGANEAGTAGADANEADAGAESPNPNDVSDTFGGGTVGAGDRGASVSDRGGASVGSGGRGADNGGSAAVVGIAGVETSGGSVAEIPCGSSVCALGTACVRQSSCIDLGWADWTMPNPQNSPTAPALSAATVLPNAASYDDSVLEVVSDSVTQLDWQRDATSPELRWAEALSYCDELVLGGHDDWRLPTRIELVSLVDFSRADPALDVIAFPNTVGGVFWTASLAADDSTQRWLVDFSVGRTDEASADSMAGVRCVR